MKPMPFWTDDFPRPADLPTQPLPAAVDVAIVGSGYTGLHAAIALRQAGVQVAVLDQATIGWGASSRNGGMLNPGLKLALPLLSKRYGLDMARALWTWSQAAIDHVEATVQREQLACAFMRSGQAYLAAKPSHFDDFKAELAWFRQELGYQDQSLVGPEDLAQEFGGVGYYGALVDPHAAGLHPARYVFGLAAMAARLGAALVERAEVRQLQRARNRFQLTTSQGLLEADAVFMATNGYTTQLAPPLRRGVFPAGSYIITTVPLAPDIQAKLSPKGRMFFDSKHFLHYFRLTPDGRMLFGGRHNLSPRLDVAQSAAWLQKRLVEIFPVLTGVPLSHSWTGQLGLTFDQMPHVGRLQGGTLDGLYYAYGYAGHGVAIASLVGKEMGEVIAGRRTATLFARLPQKRYFFTPYDKVYLPIVSAWFRLLDRLS